MIDLGLTNDVWDLYIATLADSHIIDVDVTLYDADEKPIDSLSRPINRMTSGSVTMDHTQDVSRSLDVTLLDPFEQLRFEANSPARGAVYADRSVGVEYGVYVPPLDDFIWAPVFRGPVTHFDRSGAEVNLQCEGKEMWLTAPHYATQGYMIKRRTRLDDALRDVAGRKGEKRFALPDLPQKLHNDHLVARDAEPWLIMAGGRHVDGLKSVHRETGHHKSKKDRQVIQNAPSLITLAPGHRRLIYDGRGRLAARRKMHKSRFMFTDGNAAVEKGVGPFVLTEPSKAYDPEEFRNHVVVTGGKSKGGGRIVAAASLPHHHPLSPYALARNGEYVYLTEFITADNLDTFKKCKERAHQELNHVSHMGLQIEFESLVVPFLEEGDKVTAAVGDWELDFYLNQFTLPLTASDSMAVGFTRKVDKFRHRHHARHRR